MRERLGPRGPRTGSGLLLAALATVPVALGLGLAVLVARGEEPGGIDEAWAALFGPPDLGPAEFAGLRGDPLHALATACPLGQCATVDLVVPVLPVSGARLRVIVAEVAAEPPAAELVFRARWTEEDRYLVRTGPLRLPDTINVAVIGAGEGAATFTLAMRSQVPLADFGRNRARLARWVDRIAEKARDRPGA